MNSFENVINECHFEKKIIQQLSDALGPNNKFIIIIIHQENLNVIYCFKAFASTIYVLCYVFVEHISRAMEQNVIESMRW